MYGALGCPLGGPLGRRGRLRADGGVASAADQIEEGPLKGSREEHVAEDGAAAVDVGEEQVDGVQHGHELVRRLHQRAGQHRHALRRPGEEKVAGKPECCWWVFKIISSSGYCTEY